MKKDERLVMFYGDTGTPVDGLSGLYLSGVLRKNGEVVEGSVINGHWRMRLTPTLIKAGSYYDSGFKEANRFRKPAQIHYEQIDFSKLSKNPDYNEVIETCRENLKKRLNSKMINF